jgi:hypothetical protein
MKPYNPSHDAIREGEPPYRSAYGSKPGNGTLLVAMGLQAGAVGLGYLLGADIHRAPADYAAVAFVAGLLMLIGVFASVVGVPAERVRHRTAVCIASLLYSAGVVLCDPFFHVQQTDEIAVASLVLMPLLLAIGYLVRGQAWLSVAGVTLFVFTSNVMIASNANSSSAGSGFLRSWIS